MRSSLSAAASSWLSKWNHPCVDVSPTQNDVRGKLDQYGDFTFPSELIAYDLMSGTVRT